MIEYKVLVCRCLRSYGASTVRGGGGESLEQLWMAGQGADCLCARILVANALVGARRQPWKVHPLKWLYGGHVLPCPVRATINS